MKSNRFILAAMALLLMILVSGCGAKYWAAPIEPQTSFKFSPVSKTFTFLDTKNNDLLVENVKSTIDGGQLVGFDVGKIEIRNNASDVIASDAARMEQVYRLMQLQNEYITIVGKNLADLAGIITQALPGIIAARPAGITTAPSPLILPTTPAP